MENEEARELRLAKPVAEDLIANLTSEQSDLIRQRVRASIEAVEQGEYTDYSGREGLHELAAGVKARGRALLGR
jgi:hypothetical protein